MLDSTLCRRSLLAALCALLYVDSAHVLGSVASFQNWSNPPKRVLLLYSFDNDEGLYTGFDHVLRSELRSGVRERVEFYTEYLDLVRFPSTAHAENLVKLLKLEFSEQKPDLIVPVSYSALKFLLEDGKELFPGTPVVALFNSRRLDEVNRRVSTGTSGRDITGVTSTDEPSRTLDLALRLQPDTERVAVVVGCSPVEKYWVQQLKEDFQPYRRTIQIDFLTDLTMNDVLARVAALPPHSVVLNTFFFDDARGQFFLQEEALDLVASAARAPVYGIYTTDIGHGVVGGRMTDPEKAGRQIAKAAIRVLNGERAASIPIALDNSARDTVDWRQLQRWHISESQLPPGTVELYREPSVWERYRYLIVAVLSLCIVETILILALLVSVRRRRLAEKALLQEKALADAVIESLPGVFVLQDRAGRNLRWNKNAETVVRHGLAEVDVLGNVADTYRDAVQRAREEVFERGASHVEADLLLKGGGAAPYYITAVRVELEGKPYLAAVGIDLTDTKNAEDAVRRSEAELRSFVENAPYGIGTIACSTIGFCTLIPRLSNCLGTSRKLRF